MKQIYTHNKCIIYGLLVFLACLCTCYVDANDHFFIRAYVSFNPDFSDFLPTERMSNSEKLPQVHVEVVPHLPGNTAFDENTGVNTDYPNTVDAKVVDNGPKPNPGTPMPALATIRKSEDQPYVFQVTITPKHNYWSMSPLSADAGGSDYWSCTISHFDSMISAADNDDAGTTTATLTKYIESSGQSAEAFFKHFLFTGREMILRAGPTFTDITDAAQVPQDAKTHLTTIENALRTHANTQIKVQGRIRHEIKGHNEGAQDNATYVAVLVIEKIL